MIFFSFFNIDERRSQIEVNKCSSKNCNNTLSLGRGIYPITELEKQHGLLCSGCLFMYYQNKANLVICSNCSSLIYIFCFEEETEEDKNCNDVYYCKFCENCENKDYETTLIKTKFIKQTFFQKLKTKILAWLKHN